MTSTDVHSTSGCQAVEALLEVALTLTASLSTEQRYQRLMAAVRRVVPCDAAALMRARDGALIPVAVDGLPAQALGTRMRPADHPRLQAILESRRPVRFAADDPRPDPFDHLLASVGRSEAGVHSCMGCTLHVEDELVGVLTVDAVAPGMFDHVHDDEFATFAALAAATVRTAGLIESLEKLAQRRGDLAHSLVVEALRKQGGELLGQSAPMERLRREMDVVAGSDLTVLVTGETGTGKELVARTIHARSARASQPLVYVNCAALPESIAESELFGHRKGAFTGAVADRAGKFELADGGTLFLDEIGELPLSLQPKLLRALQSGEIQRVGSDRNLAVDVRIIAATNRDLALAVREARFRPDLFHRISVFPIHVPPLRERGGDVEILASHFLDRARTSLGLGSVKLTRDALAELSRFDWPGNVRELEHVVTRAALRSAAGTRGVPVVVEVRHLDLLQAQDATAARAVVAAGAPLGDRSLTETVDEFRASVIRSALDASSGSWAEAARMLKMDRGNLYRLGKRLGLTRT